MLALLSRLFTCCGGPAPGTCLSPGGRCRGSLGEAAAWLPNESSLCLACALAAALAPISGSPVLPRPGRLASLRPCRRSWKNQGCVTLSGVNVLLGSGHFQKGWVAVS